MHFPTLLVLTSLSLLFWFPSCKDDPFEYKIDRANTISFRLDTFEIVTTDDVVFYPGPPVLHVFNDTTKVLFQRISLQAHGFTASSHEFWYIVDFDTHLDGNAVGTYRIQYDEDNGGIAEMRLIVDIEGEMVEFVSAPKMDVVFFQVDGQREEERIMKGIFGGILYQNGDPMSTPSLISDGVFKDIKY